MVRQIRGIRVIAYPGPGYPGFPPPVWMNVAVTVWLEFMVTLQLPTPEQAPLHATKMDPAFA